MSVHGNVVIVETVEEYERLIRHPDSLDGWFDEGHGTGEVRFGSVTAAQAAYSNGGLEG
jgi:hypothetical protein